MQAVIPSETIESKIFVLRGKKVMIDRDLAFLYGVETKALNQAVKRNIERFPQDYFIFQLTEEEKIELKQYPKEERHELLGMYIDDGWPEELAKTMAQTASQNKELFLKEMAYRELKVFPEEPESPLKNAVAMGIAYIIGGGVPLLPYILFSLPASIFLSISATLAGLFFVGAYTTRYSKRMWWKAGLEMLSLASLAALIGYAAGQAVDLFFLR